MNKSILKKLPALLAILAVAGGVQIFTSCSSDGDGGGNSGGSVRNCGGIEYDPATRYCSEGTIKDYELVPYEGQTYKAIVIGGQVWFAENLNYNPYSGNSVCYNNEPSNCDTYGRLYDWSTSLSVCPDGWHLPSDAEWTVLTDYVGDNAGAKLKSTSGWNNCGPSGSGSSYLCEDTYGFSVLPGGRHYSGGFKDVDSYGNWWSSTEHYSGSAYYRDMYYNSNSVYRYSDSKSLLFSVRCVKNQP